MRDDLKRFNEISDRLSALGTKAIAICEGAIFPSDIVGASVLERALNLMKGFVLLIDNQSYSCAASLLRLQLDNLIRFNGIVTSGNAHSIAQRLISGEHLRKMKHKGGGVMTDKFLVALYERKHPGVDRLYNIASGYIHFSREHVNHLLMRSKPTESGARVFHVSDEDSYLPDNYKSDLVASFATITDWLLDEVESWVEERDKHGTKAELHQRFGIVKVADVA